MVDTNLLVLYVVGTASREYIHRHKKLTSYIPEDYDALLRVIEKACAVVVTPNTLTETSNLVCYIAEPARSSILAVLKKVIATSNEVYVTSKLASEHEEFFRLGLTDAAAIESLTGESTLLTADLDLHVAALTAGRLSINFNQVRDQYL